MPDNCPKCNADLTGEPIPQEYIDEGLYAPGSTHYSRKIGIETRDYDGVLFWQCPDCGWRWHRWSEGGPLHALADRYLKGQPE